MLRDTCRVVWHVSLCNREHIVLQVTCSQYKCLHYNQLKEALKPTCLRMYLACVCVARRVFEKAPSTFGTPPHEFDTAQALARPSRHIYLPRLHLKMIPAARPCQYSLPTLFGFVALSSEHGCARTCLADYRPSRTSTLPHCL